MHTRDTDGRLSDKKRPPARGGDVWIALPRTYYGSQLNVRCHPTATKPMTAGGQNPFAVRDVLGTGWIDGGGGGDINMEGDFGNCRINDWVLNPSPDRMQSFADD